MTEHDRADRYAAGTLAVQDDPETVAAEAIFNQALTNGLIAIALVEIPTYVVMESAGMRLPPSMAAL